MGLKELLSNRVFNSAEDIEFAKELGKLFDCEGENSLGEYQAQNWTKNNFDESKVKRNRLGQFLPLHKNESYVRDVEEIFKRIKDNGNNRLKIEVGEVSARLSKEAEKNGFDLVDYKHNVDVSGVKHAFKHHGEGFETEEDQIPITEDDIKKIPEIVYNYDNVTFGLKDTKGTDIIKYQKQMPDGEIYYLEEIRTGKQTLTIKTMYKKSR